MTTALIEHYLRNLDSGSGAGKNRCASRSAWRSFSWHLTTGRSTTPVRVVDKIGGLCDYILFDSAWVGYEQFIPMMADRSPLLLDLNENDPGIFVTQSVHKQQAGFSNVADPQKITTCAGRRFCPHKRLNNAFMLHASTSPFYPLFAALDERQNPRRRERDAGCGRSAWQGLKRARRLSPVAK